MPRLLVEAFVLVLVQLITIFALFLKWLPAILRFLWLLLRMALALSCWLYGRLFALVARLTRIDLSAPRLRLPAALVLSILLGGAGLFVIGAQSVPTILACGVHGLVVALAWDQLAIPRGIITGV
jgi:hypothetical protein